MSRDWVDGELSVNKQLPQERERARLPPVRGAVGNWSFKPRRQRLAKRLVAVDGTASAMRSSDRPSSKGEPDRPTYLPPAHLSIPDWLEFGKSRNFGIWKFWIKKI